MVFFSLWEAFRLPELSGYRNFQVKAVRLLQHHAYNPAVRYLILNYRVKTDDWIRSLSQCRTV